MITAKRTFNGIEFYITTGMPEGDGIAVNPLQHRLHHIGREAFVDALAEAMEAYPAINAYHYLCEMKVIPYGELRQWPLDALQRVEASHRVMCTSPHITYQERVGVKEFVDSVIAELIRRHKKQAKSEDTRSGYIRPGFVYLVQSPTGAYKIGRTKNPEDRLKTFSVKLPFEVEYAAVIETTNMYELEYDLHTKFADKRVNGEWFTLSPEDVEYIKGLAS